MDLNPVLVALANPKRQHILESLKEPTRHYEPNGFGPEGVDVDMVTTGVCVAQVADHLNVSAATASQFLAQLRDSGLLTSERIGKYTYYRRNEKRIREAQEAFNSL